MTKTQNRLLLVALLLIGAPAMAAPIIWFNAPDWQPNTTYVPGGSSFIHPDGAGLLYFESNLNTPSISGAQPPVWCTYANCAVIEDAGLYNSATWYAYTLDRKVYCPANRKVPIYCIPSLDAGNSFLYLNEDVFSAGPIGTTLNFYGDGALVATATTSCTNCEITVPNIALPVLPCSDMQHTMVVQAVSAGNIIGIDSTSFRVDYLASDGGRDTGVTVTLTFDDTFDDQYYVSEPLIRDSGLTATFFLNWPREHGLIRGGIASSFNYGQGYLLPWQALSILSHGHEPGEHTLNHHHLDCLGINDQQNEIWNNRTLLIGDGLRIRYTAYPYGADNPSTHQALLQARQVSGRDIGGLDNTPGYCGSTPSCEFPACPYAETIPPANIFTVRAWNSLGPTCPLGDPEQVILNAEDAGGGWVIVNEHHVCQFDDAGDGCLSPFTFYDGGPGFPDGGGYFAPAYDAGIPSPTLAWPVQNLASFAQWLAARAGIGTHVQPYYQVVGGSISGLTAWDAGPIYNSDLEDYSASNESCQSSVYPLPDCFEDVSTALDASYTFVRSPIAYTGNWSTLINVNFIADAGGTASGAVREVITHSVPTSSEYYCYRTKINPSQTYTFSLWYQANEPPQLTIYGYCTQCAEFNNDAGWEFVKQVTVPATTDAGTPVNDAGAWQLASFQAIFPFSDGGQWFDPTTIWASFGMSVVYEGPSFVTMDTLNITSP